MQAVITIGGKNWGDLKAALEEVLKAFEEEYTGGFNSNDTGDYSFDVAGEPTCLDEDGIERDEDGSLTERGRSQYVNWQIEHGLAEGEPLEIDAEEY